MTSAAARTGPYHMSAQEVAESTETLRKAFRASPYQKVTSDRNPGHVTPSSVDK